MKLNPRSMVITAVGNIQGSLGLLGSVYMQIDECTEGKHDEAKVPTGIGWHGGPNTSLGSLPM